MGKKAELNIFMKISSIILTKNDEHLLEKCMNRLRWSDEIVVVDNDSSDNSKEIARKNGAKVVSIKDQDFSALRNEGAKVASHPWLLYIDTDEEVSEKLAQEIQDIVLHFNEKKDPHAYVLKRENYYLGEKWPSEDGMIRLIYKPSLETWFGKLHETAKIMGQVSELKERLIHRTHRSLEEMVEKTNRWSETEAQLRFQGNHPRIVSWRLFRVMCTGFYDSYIKQKGYRAGTVGLIESMYQGFSMFITYAKLWEMQEGKNR